MKYILAICIAFGLLIFSGCSTKRKYFEPQNIDKEMSYSQNLPSSIKYTARDGATLEDGQIITKTGLKNTVKLEENDRFIGEFDGKFIVSNLDGTLKILDLQNTVYERKFPQAIVAASLSGSKLAALSSRNTIYLVDIYRDSVDLEYVVGDTYAQDSRTAAPIFLSSLIVYPTLDGKIMIVDKTSGNIIRDAVVSSEPFFNNIIYLDVFEDKMFAATATKVMMISPSLTKEYSGQIKDVILYKNRIYVLLKDGFIEAMDLNLNSIAKTEFKFAIFSNIIPKGDYLYIIEKTGYLLKTNLDLTSQEVIELNGEIEDKSFASKNTFYYDDKILKLD
ncbi:putative lipoprotein, putative beta-barrel assembly machinery complex lipoprotein BamB [Campylobacter iguaniorum]|uniref:PQQ-binding-like beta-propeller repeat protein n=1 Tax=Campylobacter iguaniorum TaxID=1244531 RepID=UPI0007C8F9C1|nr:PQQ-binding-like beta-propeller repeat protein [Campylobacter iguaniorum]ANE36161.1 putative lipoprotein, putative beta-barrel assembly machinery complex lipoprotein BamB [Campylobacter iguaniorum]